MNNNEKYKQLASEYLVGGVSAAWNHLSEIGPIYMKEGNGARIKDVDDNEYIDYLIGWGSLFLGHNPEVIKQAIKESLDIGFGFQYESKYHIKLAELVAKSVPGVEKVRLCNSGTEATMNAIRLARIKTERKKIIKFEGHFHGQHDYLLYSMDTSPSLGKIREDGQIHPVPGSAGIPDDLEELVIPLPFNDKDAFLKAVEIHKGEIAGIILEPISLNIGCIFPDEDFLKLLREVSRREEIVLIFDEVLTGFRVGLGGAQELYGVTPDLSCFGKAFGCGMPIAALGGKKELMNLLEPLGRGQMSGTNTGRLISVMGSYNVLKELRKEGIYDKVKLKNDKFVKGLQDILDTYAVPGVVQGIGGRIGVHFGLESPPKDYREIINNFNKEYAIKCYQKAFFEQKLYGVFLPLSNCPEPITLSLAHTDEDIDETLTRIESIIKTTPYETQK